MHIIHRVEAPPLHLDAQEVVHTLVFIEKQVKTHDGRYIKVHIMPYRTQDNLIDGGVLTFIDISKTKLLELQVRSNAE